VSANIIKIVHSFTKTPLQPPLATTVFNADSTDNEDHASKSVFAVGKKTLDDSQDGENVMSNVS
jgi:hypothetical protein